MQHCDAGRVLGHHAGPLPRPRSGSRHGWSRCRPAGRGARPGGSGGSSSARTDASRPSAPCAESGSPAGGIVAPASRRAARVLRDAAGLGGIGRMLRRVPVASSTPRHCRSCRGGRSRSAERLSPARCARSRPRAGSGCGNSPCQVFAICRPPGANSSPQAYSASSSPPRAANSHSASVGRLLAGPCGVGYGIRIGDVHDRVVVETVDRRLAARRGGASWRRSVKCHHCAQSRRSTGCSGGSKTSEPALSMCGSAPG